MIAQAAPAGVASTSHVVSTPIKSAPAVAHSAATNKAIPLQEDGLTARILRHIKHWVDGLGVQLRQLKGATGNLSRLLARASSDMESPDTRAWLIHALGTLAGSFAAGLVLEGALYALLRRPRTALVAHADSVDMAALRPGSAPALGDPVALSPDAPAIADDVALVRTQKEGVEQTEAVSVPSGDGGSGGSPADVSTRANAEPSPQPSLVDKSKAHLRTLRHLPYALAALLIDLLPIALFLLVTGLVAQWMEGSDEALDQVVTSFVTAYVALRAGIAIVRALVSPEGHGLRLIPMAPATGRALMHYVRAMLIFGAFGLAIADAVQALGGDASDREAILKMASLLVHLTAVALIIHVRLPVSRHLAPAAMGQGPIATIRRWLAQVWAIAAIAIVMGLWVVWAMGVEDGFTRLLHFLGSTAAVLILARLAAVIILGGITRTFEHGGEIASRSRSSLHRYYALTRAIVTAIVMVATVIALLQVWGLGAIDWFARGTIGRSLASATLTILIAAIFAIAVWELFNTAIGRRLDQWSNSGDVVRATRLRTLLPMLRTCLLVVMVLIVCLTALSQLGVNTGPLLAGASIIGVALGFGSQKLVQDFITGIFLLMENAMQVGDWVTVGSVSGSVEYLSIRTVRLRGGDGSLYIVPFSSVTTVNNTNRGLGNAAVRIDVTYDTDLNRALDELKSIGASMREDPAYKAQILADIEVWGVDAVDGSRITLVGQVRCTDKGRWGVQREINRRIADRFRQLGIAVANPNMNVWIGKVPGDEEGSDKKDAT